MSNLKIKFAELIRQFNKYELEYEANVLEVLRSGWYINGNQLKEFEKQFSEVHGVEGCVGVNSGFDALNLTVRALGISEGDEVIVPVNTFVATALAVTENGAKPVYVDVDETYNIDVDKIEEKITNKTKAIIGVHLYGAPCDMDGLKKIADKYGLYLVEDCAQAHGAIYNDHLVGTIGDVGCFSFYPMKPVGAFGDAGAIISNDVEIVGKIEKLRNYGSQIKYHHDIKGINSRLDEIQAAILKINLKYMNDGNNERKQIARKYIEGIKNPLINLPESELECDNVYHIFPIRTKNRDELQVYLEKNGIQTQIHYPIPCHLQECYKDLNYKIGDFPIAETYACEELSLPIYVGLSDEEISYIVEKINLFLVG